MAFNFLLRLLVVTALAWFVGVARSSTPLDSSLRPDPAPNPASTGPHRTSRVEEGVAEETAPVTGSDAEILRATRTLQDLESKIQEVYDEVLPAVVGVRSRGSHGSGVIVSPDGLVLTAAHVYAEAGQRATIFLSDGRQVTAISRGQNDRADTGMLEIVGEGPWPFVELGDSDEVRTGDWCLALGHPGGYQRGRPPVLRLGRVGRPDRDLMRTDCAIASGDSGGPLFDRHGKLIGIHSRILQRLSHNFHVPVARFREEWDALRSGRANLGQAFLGVSVSGVGGGWLVESVIRRTSAARAGIVDGDIITRIADKRYRPGMNLSSVLSRFRPEQEIDVVVSRRGEPKTLSVRLGKRED